jgi:GDP-4-dehydro-6-deoxy-D-mannose reductase
VSGSAPTVLVTGAAGFAAGHLLDRLVTRPGAIAGWHRPGGTPPSRQATAQPIAWAGVDLLDAGAVDRAIAARPPDQVYHLAGATHQGRSFGQPTDVLRVNAMGTHHLLDALARHAPQARVLVTTTGFVYQPSDAAVDEDAPLRPASPYALSKLAQELIARHAGETTTVRVVRCRPFNHIGPRQSADFFAASFARQVVAIERGEMPPTLRVGNLTARRDLTDVRDVVAAYEALMETGTPGSVYNVCRGSAVSIRDVLDRMIAVSGLTVDVQVAPELLRPIDQPLLLGSNDRLRAATGWAPARSLDDTLADILEDWRARG